MVETLQNQDYDLWQPYRRDYGWLQKTSLFSLIPILVSLKQKYFSDIIYLGYQLKCSSCLRTTQDGRLSMVSCQKFFDNKAVQYGDCPWLKVVFFQKVRFVFQISQSPKKLIPKNYPEFEIPAHISKQLIQISSSG